QWGDLRAALRQPRQLAIFGLSSTVLSLNWLIYIWAVNAGHVVEGSLGYFINPLVNVLLGRVFLGERLSRPQSLAVALAALGVVYGDLGTSPLYALQEAFNGDHGVRPTPDNVVGVVSLFLWSLILMVNIKYVLVLMRADNKGEGGILALLAQIAGDKAETAGRSTCFWVLLGLAGAAMLYGDGVITPAVSVLSAMEGLQVATPALAAYVVPATVVIL
ncbi:KUP/HAK/KT family potassium transporter, partial [Pseudomonas sp. MWU12-2115]|uniref:KUP/HAK/KT family potassium transporter n=1 Tax=Pseudomonas sp. MWU12-2115 TaxID=2071713 RepID=UPI001C49A835